jgi:hypothetical protein
MHDDRLLVNVTFVPDRGYTAHHPELPRITALSLNGLRRKLAASLMPDEPQIALVLDREARIERDRRRSAWKGGPDAVPDAA